MNNNIIQYCYHCIYYSDADVKTPQGSVQGLKLLEWVISSV